MTDAKFYVLSQKGYDTYEEAEQVAKRGIGKPKSRYDEPVSAYIIAQGIAKVEAPLPEAVVTKF